MPYTVKQIRRFIQSLQVKICEKYGYTVCTHGSLKRDIDLVLIPWTDEAKDHITLIEAVREHIRKRFGKADLHPLERDEYFLSGCIGNKPHGRLVWTFYIDDEIYFDISVMPRKRRSIKMLSAKTPLIKKE